MHYRHRAHYFRIWRCTTFLLAVFLAHSCFAETQPSVTIAINLQGFYEVQGHQTPGINAFRERNPHVRLTEWESIPMPLQAGRASLSMAMAADRGPDILFGDIRQYVQQGLVYPLAEWIGEDGVLSDGQPKRKADGSPDLNGEIDADETKWPGWMELPPIQRRIATVDGKPYALPSKMNDSYVGIIYSKRLVRKAGLDPMHPPRTWDEFVYWCRKLYNPKTGAFGVEIWPASWNFVPWMMATGSSLIVQDRQSPTTGKVYTFNEQAIDFHAPDTGEDLSGAPPRWRCNVASPECVSAVELYHRLRWAPWIRDPHTGEPIELSTTARAQGVVTYQGRRIRFTPNDVIEGAVSVSPVSDPMLPLRRLGRDLAILPYWVQDMTSFADAGIPADDLGMMAYPGVTAEQHPVLQNSVVFFLMGKDVAYRGGETAVERKAFRDLVWEMLTLISNSEMKDEAIRQKVAAGDARFLAPRDLVRLGFTDYLQQMPPENLALWREIDQGNIQLVYEPFMGHWSQFSNYLQRDVIDLVLRPSGKTFDYRTALTRLEHDANTGILFERPASTLNKYRPTALVVAAVLGAFMLTMLGLMVREQLKKREGVRGVYRGWLPWVMLAPAVLSIAVWGYYPLLRGLVMAFQDYHIAGSSPFIGLTNFVSIALDPNFSQYFLATLKFVVWNLILAFFTPILLALLLAEVPRGKVFFRTLFFLPQMTSALVVTLMWKEMFVGTPSGTLNRLGMQLFGWAGFKPIDWLGDPAMVMACVIIPGVWAGAGISSLIYLAALKAVPDELYEAAALDGAGVLQRIRKITLPTILPLVLINFVGAFILTFQSMGSIFLLTFGGPGKETMVMGMAIWQEAYVNLRFHLAAAYGWILGTVLMAFTYLQLRLLRSVNFRQAKGE